MSCITGSVILDVILKRSFDLYGIFQQTLVKVTKGFQWCFHNCCSDSVSLMGFEHLRLVQIACLNERTL